MRGPAFRLPGHPAASAALAGAAALLASSCYLTSSFDGLTNESGSAGSAGAATSTGGSGGATSSDATGGTGAQGGSTSSAGGSGSGGAGGSGGSTGDPPFPATAILDDFNRPDGPPGDPWKQTEDGSYVIYEQHLTATMPNPQSILWDNAFGPRQEAFVTLSQFLPQDVELELILRNQGHPSECESVVASYNTFSRVPHAISLAYCVNGDWAGLGEPLEITLMPGDQLGFRGYEDGTLKVYVNGEEKGTWDGSPWADGKSGGRIGIFASGLSDAPLFDDFGGGDF